MIQSPEKQPKPAAIEATPLSVGEQGEISDAVGILREIGLLEAVSELDVYHGRVESLEEAGQWAIDPDYDNAGNNSGNRNVNQRPTLYAAGFEDALKFGQARGSSIVRNLVRQRLVQHVSNYTDEEKQEWLDRLNNESHASWQKIEDSEHLIHREGEERPKVYGPEDLDETQIRREVFRITREDDETTERYWAEESKAYQVSVYAIKTDDAELSVLDESFDLNALRDSNQNNMARLQNALDTLAPDLDEMIPEEIGAAGADLKKRIIDEFNGRIRRAPETGEEPTLSQDDVSRISAEMELPADQVRILASSLNAKALWMRDATAAVNIFLGKHHTFSDRAKKDFEVPAGTDTYMDGKREIPVNTFYLSVLFQRAGIIGEKDDEIRSATLGKTLKVVSFFDLDHLKAVYTPAEKSAE